MPGWVEWRGFSVFFGEEKRSRHGQTACVNVTMSDPTKLRHVVASLSGQAVVMLDLRFATDVSVRQFRRTYFFSLKSLNVLNRHWHRRESEVSEVFQLLHGMLQKALNETWSMTQEFEGLLASKQIVLDAPEGTLFEAPVRSPLERDLVELYASTDRAIHAVSVCHGVGLITEAMKLNRIFANKKRIREWVNLLSQSADLVDKRVRAAQMHARSGVPAAGSSGAAANG